MRSGIRLAAVGHVASRPCSGDDVHRVERDGHLKARSCHRRRSDNRWCRLSLEPCERRGGLRRNSPLAYCCRGADEGLKRTKGRRGPLEITSITPAVKQGIEQADCDAQMLHAVLLLCSLCSFAL